MVRYQRALPCDRRVDFPLATYKNVTQAFSLFLFISLLNFDEVFKTTRALPYAPKAQWDWLMSARAPALFSEIPKSRHRTPMCSCLPLPLLHYLHLIKIKNKNFRTACAFLPPKVA